jgi:hypothetical protein
MTPSQVNDSNFLASRHSCQSGHAKNEEGGGRGRTGAGAVEREGEIEKGVFADHRIY